MEKRKAKKNARVRYLRLINCLSMGELAYKTKIDRTHLEKIESGSAPCSELNARRLATHFGTPYEWQTFVRLK